MLKKENKEIKITREEFVNTFMNVLSNPFKDDDTVSAEDKAQMQFSLMMTGILLCKKVERELFGKGE